MKIMVFELLRRVLNGNAPKKIKYNNSIYEKSKYNATPRGYYYRIKNGIKFWFLDEINSLNDEVEIIEEEMCKKCHKYPAEHNRTYCEFCLGISKEEKKMPEKIEFYEDTIMTRTFRVISPNEVAEKVNEIIDYLKSKGE